jgi:DNA invertase Pin-like site-specific DNA recombinase
MDLYQMRSELNKGKSIFGLPLRVTFYARVSTEKDEQLHSLTNQIEYYKDFIKRSAQWTYVEGYIDEGLSGTSVKKRESFLKMLDDARLKKFDFIITKEISRFSRNTLDSIKFTQELLSYGVGVLFQSDNINTLLPDSELRLTIMSSIAQDEVRKLSERIRFGFQRAINSGVVLGNDKIWGYDKQKGKLVINEQQAEIVRKIFELYAIDNLGIRLVCVELTKLGYFNQKGNPFTFSTVRNILGNPKYKGYYCGGKTHKYDFRSNDRKYIDEDEWVMYKDAESVPAIVSEELWNKAAKIMAKRSEKMSSENRTSYQNKYSYSGKIICSDHNRNYQHGEYRYKSGNKEIWMCRYYMDRGRSGCTMPILYKTELDEIMKRCYNDLVINKSEIIHDLVKIYSTIAKKSSIKEDIGKCKVEINAILKRKDKLLDLSVNGELSDSEFGIRNKAFNTEIESLKGRICEMEAQERTNAEIEESIEKLREIIAKELDFNDGFDDRIVDSLLEKIVVHRTEEKNVILLKVYLKVFGDDDPLEYVIDRSKKQTSVSSNQYILSGAT